MPLQYSQEFSEALKPFLPELELLSQLQPHDVQSRREAIPKLFSSALETIPNAPDTLVQAFTIKSYDEAEIAVYHIYPTDAPSSTPTPAYIHVHGGGMISGNAKMFVNAASYSSSASRTQFFTVDYRKAPEAPHPTPAEDVYASLLWLMENAPRFNVDSTRVGITGESSGGGIAAGVAIMARDRQLHPPLAKQVLIYPMLDSRNVSPIEGIEELALWKANDNKTGWTALLGNQMGCEEISPYASPARVASVKNLPAIYMDVGELDIFKAEIIEYARRFADANINTELHVYPGLPHGWEGIAPAMTATGRAIQNRIEALGSI